MTDYDTIDEIEGATVTTMIAYSEGPEIRQYDVETIQELVKMVYSMKNPQHGEELINVDIRERVNV